METAETHNKILAILQDKGPSLPINIAKEMQINSLFASAFLSELSQEKRIKVSHLKVGGSPLYFLEGQEQQLEPFHKFLHPREIETFQLLKENKILKDSEQEPTTRVALRSIRDFAVGFKKNEEIFWKYYLDSEEEEAKFCHAMAVLAEKNKININEFKYLFVASLRSLKSKTDWSK